MTLGNEIERRTSESENFALPKGEGPDQTHSHAPRCIHPLCESHTHLRPSDPAHTRTGNEDAGQRALIPEGAGISLHMWFSPVSQSSSKFAVGKDK